MSGLGTPADVAARLLRPNGAMSAEEQRQDRLRRLKVRLIAKGFGDRAAASSVRNA